MGLKGQSRRRGRFERKSNVELIWGSTVGLVSFFITDFASQWRFGGSYCHLDFRMGGFCLWGALHLLTGQKSYGKCS